MIVGGFPCVGFSSSGMRLGLENSQSALFYEILRLVDELKPPLLFLENVANILNINFYEGIVKEFTNRKYTMRWCVVRASGVGAPQTRARWYSLIIKNNHEFMLNNTNFQRFNWDIKRQPPRTINISPLVSKKRYQLLGNSVVPDAVRYAFGYLASFGYLATSTLFEPHKIFKIPRVLSISSQNNPDFGVAYKEKIFKLSEIPILQNKFPGITLVPYAFKTYKAQSPLISTGVLTVPMKKNFWATPLVSSASTSNYLTNRCSRMLQVQTRFEKNTPDYERGFHG